MPRVSRGTRINTHHKPGELPTRYAPGFIATLDGRTELARLLRLRFDTIACDLGGADSLSSIKSSLLERFIWLEATLSRIEADLAATADPKASAELLSRWIQGCNSLLGIAKTLGIERQMQSVSLKTYVEAGGSPA